MSEEPRDDRSKDELFAAYYEELRAITRARLGRDRPGHTLRPTELTAEAYRAVKERNLIPGATRAEILGAFSILLRRVITDYHRKRSRQKRGGNLKKVTLRTDVDLGQAAVPVIDSLALDEALDDLEKKFGERKRDVVLLRFFGGLTFDEIGSELGISATSAKNDWRFSKAFLGSRLLDHPKTNVE